MKRATRAGVYAAISLILALVINQVALVVLDSGDLALGVRILIEVVCVLSFYGGVIAGLVLAGCLIAVISQWLGPLADKLAESLQEAQPECELPEEAQAEVQQVDDLVSVIGNRLELIESRQADAVAELNDVNVLAASLTRLVIGLMRKRRQMLEEAAGLDEAITALTGEDSVAIARAAGHVRDGLIRQMMLATDQNGDPDFRLRLIEMCATHAGDAEAGAEQLKALALSWMANLADYRSKAGRLRIGIHVMDAVRPLTMLDARLQMAQYHLSEAGDPGANRLLRHSPVAQLPME